MSLNYNIIEIFTGEDARWNGRPVYSAVVEHVRKAGIAARCMVTRGVGGCYENGEIAASKIEIFSYNMPLKIEVILPSSELNNILPVIEDIVIDGIVIVKGIDIRSYRTLKHLIPRRLKVKDVMTAKPRGITGSATTPEIIKILLSSDYHGIPVVNSDNKPIGMITQGDLISRAGMPVRLGILSNLEKERTEIYLKSIKLKSADEIMTKPVKTIEQDKLLTEAVDEMLRNNLKRMPVVDPEGRLAGMLSRYDIFRTITKESPDWGAIESMHVTIGNVRRVEDIMQRDTDTVQPETSVADISRIIDSKHMQRVAVVDNDNKLLGIISDKDLLGVFAGHSAGIWDYLMAKMPFNELAAKHQEFIKQTKIKTAADVMKNNLVTVKEKTPIEEAIKIMAEKGIKRLPVVDNDGKFKGMVSRDSVLRAGIKNS